MNIFKRVIRRIRRKRALYIINVKYAGADHRYFEKKLKAMRTLGYKVGDGTKIVGPINITTQLEIGKNCWIGMNFQCQGNGKVVIKDNCDLAPDITISTGGHLIGTHDRRAGEGLVNNTTIEEGCWIGVRSTIINSANIGAGSVVAACSNVIKDVPKNSLVAGNPAVVKRDLGDE